MTGAPILNRPPRPRSPLSGSDIATLAACFLASTAAVIIGIALLWDVLSPSDWTAGGWAAAGGWFAGAATVAAVVVALQQSRQARKDAQAAQEAARRQHEEQLRHEVWRFDLAACVNLIPTLTELRSKMYGADAQVQSYQAMMNDFATGKKVEPDYGREGGPTHWDAHHDAIFGYLSPVKDAYVAVRAAGLAARSPDLLTALTEAGDLIELMGDQLHAWSIQAGRGVELSPELDGIRQLNLDIGHGIGALPLVAQRVELILRAAAAQSDALDLRPAEDNSDASMTP